MHRWTSKGATKGGTKTRLSANGPIPIYHQECDEKKTRAATGVRANASVSAAIPDLDRSRLRREVDGHALDAGDLAQRPLHRLPAVLHALHPRNVQADVR